jgi:ribosomal protein S18 acetylase RimI-like enzyme
MRHASAKVESALASATQNRPSVNSSTPSILIRAARLPDLEALVALEQRSFDSDRISRAQYRRHLASHSAQVLMAVDTQQNLLGSAVMFFRRGSALARLYSLTSRPESRGRGVGSALVAAAENLARQRGCHAMRLEVRVDNASALHLYERLGYRRLTALPAYYQDAMDGWRYEKRLA